MIQSKITAVSRSTKTISPVIRSIITSSSLNSKCLRALSLRRKHWIIGLKSQLYAIEVKRRSRIHRVWRCLLVVSSLWNLWAISGSPMTAIRRTVTLSSSPSAATVNKSLALSESMFPLGQGASHHSLSWFTAANQSSSLHQLTWSDRRRWRTHRSRCYSLLQVPGCHRNS